MPTYRIHRIKDGPRENFRWAAHTGGTAIVKLKDYGTGEEIEASTPYAAWKALASPSNALRPGDLLETIPASVDTKGELRIAKYIGFEPAEWYVAEVRTEMETGMLSSAASSKPAER